jgi:serine-type D-Ala-D-Ala carboxypeptidase/endopeptidase (penicillin-binding protein 4)
MRIFRRLQAGALLFFLGFPGSFLLAQELPSSVAAAFRRAGIPADAIGAYAQDVNGGKVLFSMNAMLPLSPASTMKLVTTDAALELLGPAYAWKTSAYVRGQQQGDVLHGDLILRGGGDPHLVQESLWLFLRQVRARGIRDIRGDLLLDRSLFQAHAHDAAAFDGEPLKPYNAGPDALLLNFHAFNLRLVPDQQGGSARLAVDPPVAGLQISGPQLVEGECKDWKSGLSASLTDAGIVVGGVYPYACGEREWQVYPYQMSATRYFGAVFRQLWMELGGSFSGEVRDAPVPPDARLVAEWQSAPLPQIIRDVNKYSNNVMARQLLLTIAANESSVPATPERGASAVQAWLGRKGIGANDLIIDNGSGLSRVERISAHTMGRMLIAAFQAPTMPEFMSSLPVAAFDGSMRTRLRDAGVAGRAHVKTGTLEGVRAVAGYVLSASGRRYAVACMVNHANAAASLQSMDALLQWVYERG